MQPYFCACLCAVILNSTFVTQTPCKRMGVSAYALAFPAVCMMALSLFPLKPFPELRFDAAVLLFPLCMLLLAMEGGGASIAAKKLFYALFGAALLPILAEAAVCLVLYMEEGYAYVNLTSQAVALWQVLCCVAVFLLHSAGSAKKARV